MSQVVTDLSALRLVQSPPAARIAARLLLILLACTVCLLVLLPWQQNVSGDGRVVAFAPVDRMQNIEAPIDGRVTEVFVAEGSRVRAGDVLLEMADIDPSMASRLDQERAMVLLRQSAAESRVGSMDLRISSLQSSRELALAAAKARAEMASERVVGAEQGVVAAEAAASTADLNLPRVRELTAKGLRSVRDLELAELEARRAQAELIRARTALAAAEKELQGLTQEMNRIAQDASAGIADAQAQREVAKAEVANAAAELQRTDVRVSRQQSQRVTAPRDGTVLRVLAPPGGPVLKAGAALLTFVPDADAHAAEIWVKGNDAALMAPGRKVRLVFEGWPAVQWAGWPAAAVGTYGGIISLVDATDDGRGRFRVLVVPDPAEPAWPDATLLRQGVRVRGWVLLNQVRLGYELWRQANGFPADWPSTPLNAPTATSGKATAGKKP